MITKLCITKIFSFVILFSFASTAFSATVNSESGGASLNGTWAFPGCSEPDSDDPPGEQAYEEEYLIFQGFRVESRTVSYDVSNGGCTGVGSVESEFFDFTIEDDKETMGWLGEDEDENEVVVDPPSRMDGNGELVEEPVATIIEFIIPGEPGEAGYWYMDDTGTDWYLYRDAGEDGMPSDFMSIYEPLVNSDPDIGVVPVPAAVWLFGTALVGLFGFGKRRKA